MEVRAALRWDGLAIGFAPLLWEGGLPTPLTKRARPAIDEVIRAIAAQSLPDATRAARNLIGLGDGLTPSGDDFLIGVGAALRAAGHPMHDRFMETCRDLARGRTTTVAEAFYRHAPVGAYTARVHRPVATLADPDVE